MTNVCLVIANERKLTIKAQKKVVNHRRIAIFRTNIS